MISSTTRYRHCILLRILKILALLSFQICLKLMLLLQEVNTVSRYLQYLHSQTAPNFISNMWYSVNCALLMTFSTCILTDIKPVRKWSVWYPSIHLNLYRRDIYFHLFFSGDSYWRLRPICLTMRYTQHDVDSINKM